MNRRNVEDTGCWRCVLAEYWSDDTVAAEPVKGGLIGRRTGSNAMTRYLISFDDGAMAHIPDDDWPAVGEASHAVVQEAKDAGVWIHDGGV